MAMIVDQQLIAYTDTMVSLEQIDPDRFRVVVKRGENDAELDYPFDEVVARRRYHAAKHEERERAEFYSLWDSLGRARQQAMYEHLQEYAQVWVEERG